MKYAADKPPAGAQQLMDRHAIENEIRLRASRQTPLRQLVVDYYRIRRRLAYPVPLRTLFIPTLGVPTVPQYPWATWLMWTLEERIGALGWAADLFRDAEARTAAAADLGALSEWPVFRQYPQPDLASAHAARILWTAYALWHWPNDMLRARLRRAALRHLETGPPELDKLQGPWESQRERARLLDQHRRLGNMWLIGTLGTALAASVAQHPEGPRLNTALAHYIGGLMTLRGRGVHEGVSYDGYVLDFVADWLRALPARDRALILDHPALPEYLDESLMLGAPGAPGHVAELGDVEAREMPFHLSAQAKLLRFRRPTERIWLVGRSPMAWLHTGALATLHGMKVDYEAVLPPRRGALNAHHAVVLRSGWEADDMAVAMSHTRSPLHHLQCDNGTVIIGTRGRWIIDDPGYQQYLEGPEREFTIGPAAHNCPVIAGHAQVAKRPRLLALEAESDDTWTASIDLTACYPRNAGVRSAIRTVWLSGRSLVVIADTFDAGGAEVAYHWHAHPDAAWWIHEGEAQVTLAPTSLWLTSPQVRVAWSDVQRLPGSRGQVSLLARVPCARVVWWIFSLGARPFVAQGGGHGRWLEVFGQTFTLGHV